jgi:hypothetical protein
VDNEIRGKVGDDTEQAAIGNNIKQDRTVVNVNTPHYPHIPPQDERGRIMPQVEIELRQIISKLTEAVYTLNTTVALNKQAMDINTTATNKSIGVIEEQIEALKLRAEDDEVLRLRHLATGEDGRRQAATDTRNSILLGAILIVLIVIAVGVAF